MELFIDLDDQELIREMTARYAAQAAFASARSQGLDANVFAEECILQAMAMLTGKDANEVRGRMYEQFRNSLLDARVRFIADAGAA